jgi:hypothetical protein
MQKIQKQLDDIITSLTEDITNKMVLSLALDPMMWMDSLVALEEPKQEATVEEDSKKYPWNFATKFEWEIYKTMHPNQGYPCKHDKSIENEIQEPETE